MWAANTVFFDSLLKGFTPPPLTQCDTHVARVCMSHKSRTNPLSFLNSAFSSEHKKEIRFPNQSIKAAFLSLKSNDGYFATEEHNYESKKKKKITDKARTRGPPALVVAP